MPLLFSAIGKQLRRTSITAHWQAAIPMSPRNPAPWRELLADPGPDGHIVQLYQDEQFYGEAISHFAAEGLARGESIILVATAHNWENISARLTRKGFDLAELRRRGQLSVLDADATLPKFVRNNVPHADTFKAIARATIEKARAGGMYPRVRWWGEMVNVLYVDGNGRGSTRLGELFDEVAHEERIAIFCSFLMDKFDKKIYDGPLGDVCRTHAHLIPAEDYVLHRNCVDEAVAAVYGDLGDRFLKSLPSAKGSPAAGMPASQALLLWLKEAEPDKFDEVIDIARSLEKNRLSGGRHE
jgi:hypothetical protein